MVTVSLPRSSHRYTRALTQFTLAMIRGRHASTRPSVTVCIRIRSTKPGWSKEFRWLGASEFNGSSYLPYLFRVACNHLLFVRAKVPAFPFWMVRTPPAYFGTRTGSTGPRHTNEGPTDHRVSFSDKTIKGNSDK